LQLALVMRDRIQINSPRNLNRLIAALPLAKAVPPHGGTHRNCARSCCGWPRAAARWHLRKNVQACG